MRVSTERLHVFARTAIACVCISALAGSMSCLAVGPYEIRYEFDDPEGFWDGEILDDTAKYYFDVKAGWLTLRTQMGGILTPDCLPPNLFCIPFVWSETSTVTIDMRIDFTPRSNYQIAGPILFQDVDNFVMLGRAYCDDPGALGTPCVGSGIYFDYEEQGQPFPDSSGNFATDEGESAPREVWLRLQGCGTAVDAFYSHDGSHWVHVGRHEIGFVPTFAGFGAWSGCTRTPAIYAHFDYFLIRVDSVGCSEGG